MPKLYEFLEHTADIKFKTTAKSLPKLFENCLKALSHYMTSDSEVKSKLKKEIEIQADDKEALLYKFLDEIIYLVDAENFIPAKANIEINEHKLKATLQGDLASKYSIKHVKAATYAEMYIKQDLKGWEAQVVLDV